MALIEIEIMLKWENGVSFEMTEKEDDGAVVSIIKVEENANIASIWPHIREVCKAQIEGYLNRVGDEMKS
ncbi:hypothetical protein LCGC14_2093510 [marine sediment metagenome]|uniref:Uncharacterized protein n=1 Tax=marine sediment metagenome TaxID=412755 RepID=A0A0F9GQ39_9ZZZZ